MSINNEKPQINGDLDHHTDEKVLNKLDKTLDKKHTEKLSALDLFRNRILLRNALAIWFGWCVSELINKLIFKSSFDVLP